MGTIKPQRDGPYGNAVIGTLAVDGWAVTFGTARRALLLAVPNVTAHPWPIIQSRLWHCNYLCTLKCQVNASEMWYDDWWCQPRMSSYLWGREGSVVALYHVTTQTVHSTPGPVSAWMGDHLGQINHLGAAAEPATQVNSAWAIPRWVGAVSTSISWGVNRHIAYRPCISGLAVSAGVRLRTS